jgi:hypothetical protein
VSGCLPPSAGWHVPRCGQPPEHDLIQAAVGLVHSLCQHAVAAPRFRPEMRAEMFSRMVGHVEVTLEGRGYIAPALRDEMSKLPAAEQAARSCLRIRFVDTLETLGGLQVEHYEFTEVFSADWRLAAISALNGAGRQAAGRVAA